MTFTLVLTKVSAMNLKTWLNEERGRYTALAAELGVSVGRISQMADDGVPPKYMLAVRAFTKDVVSLESLVQDRTTTSDEPIKKPHQSPTHNIAAINLDATDQERREVDRREESPSATGKVVA